MDIEILNDINGIININMINDTSEFINIIDYIVPDESYYFNDHEIDELYDLCLYLIDEYISENPTIISEPDFDDLQTEPALRATLRERLSEHLAGRPLTTRQVLVALQRFQTPKPSN